MDNLFSLEGKIILVTGATGHLGSAISEQLCKSGATVLINSRNKEKADTLTGALKEKGYNCASLSFDISKADDIELAYQRISDEYGQLDALVNNAYKPSTNCIGNITEDEMDESLSLNVTAPFMLVQKFLSLFGNSDAPSIVNIASMYGMVSPDPSIYDEPQNGNPPYYGAGKAALIQLTRYMACHLADKGIRVNAISPGPFPPETIKEDNPEFHQKLIQKVPLKRIGHPDEIGGCVQFLISDAASYITGTNIPVDGGWTAW